MHAHTKVLTVLLFFCLSQHTGLFASDSPFQPLLYRGRQPVPTAAKPSRAAAQPVSILPWYPLTPIIGRPGRHIVTARETLLDIARRYDLGYNELEDLYPRLDPWILAPGLELRIPTQRLLPGAVGYGIVINIPEMRLYYFTRTGDKPAVLTFPIGIGDLSYPTPIGTYWISSKEINPTWDIPPSLQAKHGVKSIPAGPDNPLGTHWMRLGNTMYGIHGTNFPWSVGRMATHGCIRLYPEDIKKLFPLIEPGTRVRIIYEPVKLIVFSSRVFIEVHRDVYHTRGDLLQYSENLLAARNIQHLVDSGSLSWAVAEQNGMPVEITAAPNPSLQVPGHQPSGRIRINPFQQQRRPRY